MAKNPFTFRKPSSTGGGALPKAQTTKQTQTAQTPSASPFTFRKPKATPASTPNVPKSNTSAGALPTAFQSVSKQITDAAAKVKGQARQMLPKASQATRTGGTLPAARKSSGLTGAELSASIDMFKPSSALWRASAGVQPGSAADVQHRAVESALTRVNYQLERAKAEDDKLGMSFASVDPRGSAGVRNAEAHSKAVSEKRKEIEDLSAQKAQLEFQRKYGFLQYNPDFEEKSRPDPAVIQARVKSIITGEEDPDTYENPVYAAVNGDKTAQRQLQQTQGYTYTDVPEDVAKVYNYLYQTQGAKAAQDYLDQAVTPEVTTHGAISRAAGKAFGWQGVTDLLTGGATAKHNEAVAGAAAGQHPVAYNVAAGVSGLGGMVIGGDILGGAAEALPMASKLSPTALNAAKSTATFGSSTAVQNVSPMLAGNITPGEYALSVAGSAAGGGLGSLAAKGMTSLGTKALFKTGLQNNVFANALNQGLGGATFAGVNAGTKAVIDPNYNPTGGELATDMAVSFAFQTITSAISLAATTKQAKAAMRQEAEALKRDFYNLSEAKKAGVITDADTLELLRYRSATLRNKLNTTQYIGAGKEVRNALAFLDQLDDAVAAAEHGLHGTMLGSAAPAPGAGTGASGVPILSTGGSPAPSTPGPTSPAGLASTGDATTAPGVGQIPLLHGAGASSIPSASQATTGEKTASTGEAASVRNLNRGETEGVVQKLKDNIPALSQAKPVAQVSVAAVNAVEGRTMAEKAKTLFHIIKGIVTRPGFGDVEITDRSARDDISHGVGPAKAAVIPAIREVIRCGQQIDFQSHWKGRPYDGYVFAAPVMLDGDPVYVAAVVKQTSKNHFYLHEVVDSNGNIIKMGRGESANPTSLAANGDAGTQSPLLEDSIAQTTLDVKGTLPRDSEAGARPTAAQGQAGTELSGGPVKQSLDEVLGQRGLSSPTSGVHILSTGGSPAPSTGQIPLPRGTGTSTFLTAPQTVTGEKTASTGETAEPARVGRATVIQRPYTGATPDSDPSASRIVPSVQEKSVKTAQDRIADAGFKAAVTGRSARKFLTMAYESLFPQRRDIPVSGLTMDGEPYVVSIHKSAIGKVISDKNMTPAKLAALDVLDDIVKNGKYVGSGEYIPAEGRKVKDTIRFDYFETQTTIDGKPFLVTFDVEVFPGLNNYRTHKVINEMDLVPLPSVEVGNDQPQSLEGRDPSGDSIPQTPPGVNPAGAVETAPQTVGVRIAVRDMVPSAAGSMDSQIYNWNIKKGTPLDGGGPGQNPNATDVSSDVPSVTPLDGGSPGQGPLSSGVSSDAPRTIVPQAQPGVKAVSPKGPKTDAQPTAPQAVTGEKTASTGETGTLPDMDRTFESRKVPTFEELTAKADVPVVDIRQRPEGRMDKQRAAFRESVEALDVVGQPLPNDDTGAAVFVTSKTFSHMFSDLGLDQVGAAQKLREIIKSAILTHAEPSRNAPSDNTTGVYTLFGAVRTEAGIQPVKLTIKEYRFVGQDIPKEIKSYFERSGHTLATYAQNYDTKVLELADIKREGASSSAPTDAAKLAAVKHPSAPSSISVADLLGLVKGNAEKYIPTPSSTTTATKDAGMPLPTAQEQEAVDDDAMDAENWDSLMRTFEAPLEPLSDEWYESLLTTGETGYVPKETRSATDIAVDQGLEEYQEVPRAPRRPTAEEVEADKFNQAMATFGKKMLKDYDSKAEGVEADLQDIFRQMGADGGLSRAQLEASTQELARRILAQSSVPDETAYQDSKPVRALLRDRTIHVPPEVASNIPDFADFRKRYFGSMKLSSAQGREIDDLFRELGGLDPGYFNETEYPNPADQLARIAEYLDAMKPTSSNPYEAVMDDASAYLGKEIADTLLQLDSRRRALRAAASVREAQAAFFASAGPNPRGPEKVAEVMTELPTAKAPVRERGKELRHSLYRALVDSGETVGRIGKAIGDDSLYSFYNFARASGSAGQNMLARGGYQADIWGKKVGPSLGDIFTPIREKGMDYYRDFQMYLLHMHNVDRMSRYNPEAIDIAQADFDQFRNAHPEYDKLNDGEIEAWAATGDIFAQEYMRLARELSGMKNTLNKPVFGEDVDAAESRGAANQLLRSHPEFKDLAEGVYQYSRNLLQYRVDSGMMTPEDMDMIQATYPHYVPVFRITDSDAKIVKQSGIRISKGLGHATGGNADIVPLHVAMARQTMNVVRNGSANRFAGRLVSGYYANKDTVSSDIFKVQETASLMHPDTFDMLDDPTPKDKNAFTVYKDGEALTVTASKGLLTAMGALTGKGADWMDLDIWRPVEAMNTLFKELVTGYNPMFTIRNAARDLQEAGLYSRDPVLWAKAYPRAVQEIATNGPLWQRYKSLGGIHASVYDYNKGYTEAGDGHSKLRKYTLDKVDILNEGVEQAPRLAEFIAQLEKNGDTPEGVMDAMYAAHNVTTNFGRSGEVTKFLNKTFVPFLNPGVQGLDKMGRTFFGKKSGREWLKLIKRCVVLGFLPMLINEVINQGAPNWEDVRDSDKDANWLIHIGDGKYLRIPKGRDISVVGMVGDRAVDAVRGQKVDVGGTLKTAADQIAPASPFSNNIFAAFLDADLFDPSSPGKTWYGGDIESQRLQSYEPGQRYDEKTDAISKAIGGAVNVSPKKINYLLDQYTGVAGDFVLPLLTPAGDKDPLSPFTKAFVLDAATSNSVSTDFYDTIDQITYDINGGNTAKSLSAKFMGKQSSAVSDIYKQIRATENSDLPNSEKVAKVRDLKIAAAGIQKNALEVLPTFEAAVEKHLTGTDDEALDAAYREANREVFGAEYALQMEGKAAYEKAQEAHALGASYESYYAAHVKLKGKTTTWEKEQAFREMDIPEADRNAIFSATQGDTSYLKFKHAGLAQEDAQRAAWAVDTLLPSYGRNSVSNAQKWRAVLNCGIPQDKAVDALGAIMDDTQTRKLEAVVDCGISPTVYVTFRELMAKESGQGQETTERVLDAMVLDKKQKAVLWQMQNTSWKADSNPYSRVVGRQVKEIYEGKK